MLLTAYAGLDIAPHSLWQDAILSVDCGRELPEIRIDIAILKLRNPRPF
jgi:hypothetical protein